MLLLQFKRYISFLLVLLLFSCNSKKPLIPKDFSNEKEKNNTLFVFVGEKIDVKELPPNEGSWDGKYLGKYKILQRVYGNCNLDTIEFIAYDHYGEPAFSRYKNVLLFVSEHKGKYYHEKYQFYDVYKTKDDRWAGSYPVSDLGYDNKRNGNISAQKIDFTEDAFIALASVNKKEIGCWFPEPYYRIEKERAIVVYGNYTEDLFKIKKEGALSARGLFGNEKSGNDLHVPDTQMPEIVNNNDRRLDNDWKKFMSFWNKVTDGPDSLIARRLDNFVSDSIFLNDTLLSKQNSRIKEFISNEALQQFKKNNDLNYRNIEASGREPLFKITTITDTINTFESKVQASFVKTKVGFKLYSIKEEKKCICWQ